MKIAILDDYQNIAFKFADWTDIRANHEVSVFNDTITDMDALVARLSSFEIICAMRERTPFGSDLLERLPNLKLLITSGAKNNSFDMIAAKAKGIMVCGTDGGYTTTAELVFGLMLSMSRNLMSEAESFRQGGWQIGIGENIHGKTLGLVGLGRLGSKVASIAKIFGMNVIAWSPNLTQEKASEHGVTAVTKQELFKQADFISVHVVSSPRSRNLVDAEAIGLMKPTARLINTSRSAIVSYPALIEALQNDKIAGAAIDVFDVEPVPENDPVRTVKNLIATPHIGYVTQETFAGYQQGYVAAINGFVAGEPVFVLN